MTRTREGAGAATASGMDYQARVGAWLAVALLSDEEAAVPWLPSGGVSRLELETAEPVPDINVRTTDSGRVLCEIKRRIRSFTANKDSRVGEVVAQVVRQIEGSAGAGRPLLSPKDRIVLVTDSESARSVVVELPVILRSARETDCDGFWNATACADTRKRFVSLVDLVWSVVHGSSPTRDEVWGVAKLFDVVVLDVQPGGDGEIIALDRLTRSVIAEKEDATQVWATLVEYCSSRAQERASFDAPGLRGYLRSKSVRLKSTPSYALDIEQLQSASKEMAGWLRRHRTIPTREGEQPLERMVADVAQSAAVEGDLVLVGEPGAGKSGLLAQVFEALVAKSPRVVLLAVDKLQSTSPMALRSELGLTHGFLDALANWEGGAPGVLIIDALDAARGEQSARMLGDLIGAVMSSDAHDWNVLASIRHFDLQHSPSLRAMFSGEPPNKDLVVSSLRKLRHVFVPLLGGDELRQLESKSPELWGVWENASPSLKALLRNPFNLRLMAELLLAGISPDELSPIRAQVELLNSYWEARVEGGVARDQRRELLVSLSGQMLADRALQVRSDAVSGPASVLKGLCSDAVLTLWNGVTAFSGSQQHVAFSHHVLFDYAVARLLCDGAQPLAQWLAEDELRILVVRPSVRLYFEALWYSGKERRSFWQVALDVTESSSVPLVAKLVAPVVAVELATVLGDFDAQRAVCRNDEDRGRQLARSIIGAVVASPTRTIEAASLWLEWAGAMYERADTMATAYSLLPLLAHLLEWRESLAARSMSALGALARTLLRALQNSEEGGFAAERLLPIVLKTASTDFGATSEVLQPFLAPKRVVERGANELPIFARHVLELLGDAELIEQLYLSAFGYRDDSRELEPMGPSQIHRFTAPRSQNYEHALWQLAESFPEVVRAHPESGVRAVAAAVDYLVENEHADTLAKGELESFEFDDVVAHTQLDFSSIWDHGGGAGLADPLRLLEELDRYLGELAEDPQRSDELDSLLKLVAGRCRYAVYWRRLLRLGAKYPSQIGSRLRSLSWAGPLLSGYDTLFEAGQFLAAVYSDLSHGERGRAERAILSIGEGPQGSGRRLQGRLLSCIPAELIETGDARELLSAIRESGEEPRNEPPFAFTTSTSAYGEREYLLDQGVDIDTEANQRLQALGEPVAGFASRFVNEMPKEDDVREQLPFLGALHGALAELGDAADETQRVHAQGSASSAAAAIARSDALLDVAGARELVEQVLVEAAGSAYPPSDVERNRDFDRGPSWGKPAPRVDAAEGIIALTRFAECSTGVVVSVLNTLSKDPANSVRFQIAGRLLCLYETNPELMWELLDAFVDTDSSPTVVEASIDRVLRRLAGHHPSAALAVGMRAHGRFHGAEHAAGLREGCAALVLDLWLYKSEQTAGEVLEQWVASPLDWYEEVSRVVLNLRDRVGDGGENEEVRKRRSKAVVLLTSVATEAAAVLNSTFSDAAAPPPAEAKARAKRAHQLIDSIATQLYFASGAFDTKSDRRQVRREQFEPGQFFAEVEPVFCALIGHGHPEVIHRVVETLLHVLPGDPLSALGLVARAVKSGAKHGYQFEALGAKLVVALVARCLADFRIILRESDAAQRAVVELLNVFADAGWPEAYQLTYRLEDIYR